MLLSEACEAYIRDVIAFRSQSAKTEESHCVALKSLIQHVGDLPVESLTFEHVRKWKQDLDKRCSPLTVRCYLMKIRVLLAHLKKSGVSSLDPDMVPLPKRQDKVPLFVTKQQVTTLIASTQKIKNKAVISMLYGSGLRISELCALDRGSIQDDGTFTVIGKGNKPRLCFSDERTRLLVGLYLESRRDNQQALFLTEAGRRITPGTVQETFKSVRKVSGIECSPHTLRHSFATDLLRNNANMRYVQEMLGHKSLATTQMYTHVVNRDLQKVYNEFHTI